MTRLSSTALTSIALFASGCSDLTQIESLEEAVVFTVGSEDETFRVAVEDADVISQLDDFRISGERVSVIFGALLPGDGEFNAPYDWHLDPGTVELPDVAMELCDGRPSFVQENLDYWLETIQVYCPWGVRVLDRQ